MRKLFVVPEQAIKDNMLPYVRNEHEYQLQLLDYPRYDKTGMFKQAEMLGMKVFDVAIPIEFVRDCVMKTGQNPVGHVVMCYDNNMCGNLVGITREGKMLMDVYNHIQHMESKRG